MELWERIVKARTAAGLSQTQACLSLGVEQAELEAWEQGEKEPSISQMDMMCQVFHVSSGFLLSGKDPEGLFTERTCPACGTTILPGVKFCPECGLRCPAAASPGSCGQEKKTYTVVISTDTNHSERAEKAIRQFFDHPDEDYLLLDGRRLGEVAGDDRFQVCESLITQMWSRDVIMLCRGVSLTGITEIIKLFRKAANVFVYEDEAGTTLEELGAAEPERRYLLPPDGSGSAPSWQPRKQDEAADKDSGLRTLLTVALVLLIIVLALSLL